MRITKHGHACVRFEHDGRTLVLDPGGFTERAAVEGADAVLITHEHLDHYDLDHLRATDAAILTIAAVAEQVRAADPAVAERTTVVSPGQSFDAAGFSVRAVGEQHAVIHSSLPTFANSGYVVEADGLTAFHPGDAFTLPGQDVDLLCLPVSAPWCKLAEVMDFARAVGARRSLAVHDLIHSDLGLGLVDGRVSAYLEGVGDYVRVAAGDEVPLP